MQLRKYLATIRVSWENGFVYRLNFLMWRFRLVIQLLVIYYLWLAIFQEGGVLSGYSKETILTYILGTSVLRSFVLGSRSQDAGVEIATGDLNNFLVKPLDYFGNWFSRDLADKALNFIFVVIEMAILLILLKPPLFIQSNLLYLSLFILAAVLAMLIYFYLSFLVSAITFWYPEHNGWPARFLLTVIIDFFSGGLFPLDIFPASFFRIISVFPPAYFLFYPLQIYLGRLGYSETAAVLCSMVAWLVILRLVSQLVWKKGIRIYGAYGR